MKDSFVPSKHLINPQWYIVDANDKCLGRLASTVVKLLLGKHKVFFTPAQNIGDYIIVINAKKIKISGKKNKQKIYMRHSGRPGGKKIETFEDLKNRIPERIFEQAVKGMLPKNILGRRLFTKLKVYSGKTHPHHSQEINFISL
jgi:large subunit ribosomal protein L13